MKCCRTSFFRVADRWIGAEGRGRREPGHPVTAPPFVAERREQARVTRTIAAASRPGRATSKGASMTRGEARMPTAAYRFAIRPRCRLGVASLLAIVLVGHAATATAGPSAMPLRPGRAAKMATMAFALGKLPISAITTPLRLATPGRPMTADRDASSAAPFAGCIGRIDVLDDACAGGTGGAVAESVAHASAAADDAIISGLPWRSGAACGGPAFGAWRGRKLDVHVGWAPTTSWPDIAAYFERSAKALIRLGGTPSIGMPMLTRATRGRFADCTAGRYDIHYRNMAHALAVNGGGRAIIRIGWEANGDWFPWSIGDQVPAYKACFARIARIFRRESRSFKIEWPMAKRGRIWPIMRAYPGDDYVDYVGVTAYDRFPVITNQAVWDEQRDSRLGGGPYGIGSWLAYAREHGKRLAISEWGINAGYESGKSGLGFDNPSYIRLMARFFRFNAGSIAYESYYNCRHRDPTTYTIFPPTFNPKASAAYRAAYR